MGRSLPPEMGEKKVWIYSLDDEERGAVKICLMGNHSEKVHLIKMDPHVDEKENEQENPCNLQHKKI